MTRCGVGRDGETSWTALLYSIAHNEDAVAKALIEAGADVNAESTKTYKKKKSDFGGLDMGDHERWYGDIGEKDPRGNGDNEHLIGEMGWSTYNFYRGCTPLLLAVGRDDPTLVSLLLAHGADYSHKNSRDISPALFVEIKRPSLVSLIPDGGSGGAPATLAVGARVKLAAGYRSKGDAADGPLKEGDVGIIAENDGSSKPFKVKAGDKEWWYESGALQAAGGGAPAVPTLSGAVFTVEGCGEAEFNGAYTEDGREDGCVRYRKMGGGKWTLNRCSGKWYMCYNYGGCRYKHQSGADGLHRQPPGFLVG